jgi:hypothetical protein
MDAENSNVVPETVTAGMWDEFVDDKPQDTPPVEKEKAAKEEAEDTPADEPEAEDAGDNPEGEDAKEEKSDEDEPEPEEPADPWDAVPEELRTEHNKLAEKLAKYEHENRSNRARVAALQKKVDALSAKEDEPKAQAKEPPAKDLDAFFNENESWKKFAEDYEEVAKPIKDAISLPLGTLRDRLEKAEKLVETLSVSLNQQHQHSELQTLNKEVPDWFETIRDHNEEFNSFVDDPGSPEELRQLRRAIVDANSENIVKSSAVAWLVKEFKSQLAAKNPPAPKVEQRKPDLKPVAPPLTPKRGQQLKSAVSVPPKSAPSPGSRSSDDLPDTEDRAALWNAFVNKIERVAR